MRRISLFLAAAVLVVVAIPASATPAIKKEAEAKKLDTAKGCATCHVGAPKKGGELNAEGKKWAPKK